MDIGDDAHAAVENISSPSSVAELSASEEATMETMEEGEKLTKPDEEGEASNNDDEEEGEIPSKDGEKGEQPSKEEEEEGEEGEILSDSDEDDQAAAAIEATNETTSNSKSSEGSSSKKGSSQDHSNRDGRRSPSPRDRYQDRRRYRYSGHSQSPSSSSRSPISSSSNHLARKGVKRPASNDRRTGTDIRNRKEGSPFTKRKPKMKAPPPSNSPFWGERKHLLPTPSTSPRTGYNLDSDYPQLPRRLVKEYFPDPPIRFVRDSHNFLSDHSKSDYSQSSANYRQTEKDNDVSSQSDVEDMATQECEDAVPSLPSMQDLVKSQLYNDNNNETEALPPPLIEDKSMETAETLADVFSEDFPLLDGETPEQEATSLKRLVAGGSGAIDITIAAGEQKVISLSLKISLS